jgi:hypothetical protein
VRAEWIACVEQAISPFRFSWELKSFFLFPP